MNVNLDFSLTSEQVRVVGMHLGKLPEDVTESDVNTFFARICANKLEDLIARRVATIPSNSVLLRRVEALATDGVSAGSVPLPGVTDRELVQQLSSEYAVPNIRWARYRLVKKGVLSHIGSRSTGKVWGKLSKAV
jgi:hypothetical protein